ncbi:glycosyltransferase family 2 protein [Gayadomonas joobiniege]|uniref:glycosyltransferase family 2 protein n=1 Tax=Gayadomonas joobiniege TaxID=1234606 RepID=UPI000371F68A|nr:glycosyltransferase family 2 protein [Gayadomonas joobiniege]
MIPTKLAIVICNYNKKDYLKRCLLSLLNSELGSIEHTIIIVDNASTDGSVEMLEEQFSSHRFNIVKNVINTGGSGGFNRGIEIALNTHAEYLALLDNDIELEPDTLVKLISHLEHQPEVGVAGAKICTMDRPEVLQELGSFIDWHNFSIRTPFKGYLDTRALPKIVECDYVPACCLVAKREAVLKAGNFATEHFIYWDDMDWCWRIKLAGYQVHAMRDATVRHKMGAINSENTFSAYYFERNRILFFLKHIQAEQVNDLIDQYIDKLVQMSFFSHKKGCYNTAVSQLLALNALFSNQLGRRDDHIFEKEQHSIFSQFDPESQIILTCLTDIENLRKIVNALKQTFKNIQIQCQKKDIQLIKKHFPEYRVNISGEFEYEPNSVNLYAVDHVLYSLNNNVELASGYLIDAYSNLIQNNQLESLKSQYFNYKSIIYNIFKPLIKEQFLSIHQRLHTSK